MEITDSNKVKLSTRRISANSTNSLYSLIGKASVKVTINKKTYKVKSNKNGSFTVKLKKKFKQKDKIKVTVSLKGYKSKTAVFKVR